MFSPKIEFQEKNSPEMVRLLKEFDQLKTAFVTIGFHEGAGSYDDGTEVVEVALWNEFGTKKVP